MHKRIHPPTHPPNQLKKHFNITLEGKEVSIEVANILTFAICSERKQLCNRQLQNVLPESQLEKCYDYAKIPLAKEAEGDDIQM